MKCWHSRQKIDKLVLDGSFTIASGFIAHIIRSHGEDWTEADEQSETFRAEKYHDYLQFHTNYPESFTCCVGKLLN